MEVTTERGSPGQDNCQCSKTAFFLVGGRVSSHTAAQNWNKMDLFMSGGGGNATATGIK